MCGIAGVVGGNPEKLKPVVAAMTDALSHRGPDAQDVVEISNGAFGHARLSILDTTEASNQPFSTDNQSWLTYNGEIYNYRDLRATLEQNGETFSTSGDTEVLYRLWRHSNRERLFTEMTGMFAFGFWDDKTESLTLVRDRIGIKPLYYGFQDGVLYFASELRAMMAAGFRSLNHSILPEFLTLQSIPGEQTLLKDVHKVNPGEIITWTPGSGSLNREQYYDLTNPDVFTEEESSIEDTLRASVSDRLVSDVPLGAFLSGGIDSTLVVALMQEQTNTDVNTFTVGFDDAPEDEREIARMAAEHLQTRHHEIICTREQVLDKIPQAVQNLDVPGGDAVNTYLVAGLTREQGIKVALSGLGGDELFGGYPSFEFYRKVGRMKMLLKLPKLLRAAAAGLIFRGHTPANQKLRQLLSGNISPSEVVRTQRTVFNRQMLSELGMNDEISFPSAGSISNRHEATELSLSELHYYCIPLLLQDTDQTSMAHALEVRVPLLDHRLVGQVLRNPQKANALGRPPKSKLIELLQSRVPREIWDRPKQGFVLPMDSWMKGELKSFTLEGLSSDRLRKVMDGAYIDQLRDSYLNGDESITWSRIWLLAVLGHWLENNRIAC